MTNWSTRRKVNPKPKEDLPDFDDNFMSLLRQIMPEGVVPTGWPLYRRGGSYRHWTTGGGNNYVPTGFTQIGVWTWEGSDYHGEDINIVFPRPFAGRPLIWAGVVDILPSTQHACLTAIPDPWRFYLNWYTRNGLSISELKVSWLAMGPGAAT